MTETNRNTFTKVAVSLLPTILAILVMAGGWVYNYATIAAELRDHERRITAVETTYLPHADSEEREAGRGSRRTCRTGSTASSSSWTSCSVLMIEQRNSAGPRHEAAAGPLALRLGAMR